jgi:hypothetical protein
MELQINTVTNVARSAERHPTAQEMADNSRLLRTQRTMLQLAEKARVAAARLQAAAEEQPPRLLTTADLSDLLLVMRWLP